MGGKKGKQAESSTNSKKQPEQSKILKINRYVLRNGSMMYDVDIETNGQKNFAILPTAELQNRNLDKLVNYLEDEVVRIIKARKSMIN